MAKIELIIPFILKWETGNVIRPSESLEAYYNRCKASKGGISNDPDDSGGYTICGVTHSTYRTYCKAKRLPDPTKADMKKALIYTVWLDVLKRRFWNKCKCDQINNQSVALIVLDWFWGSGLAGIKALQRCLSLKADGIIGPKTLATLIDANPRNLFEHIRNSREQFFWKLVERRPKDGKYLKGWLRRLNDIPFTE